jgi:hypothetical protein
VVVLYRQGKLIFRPPELSGNSTSSHLVTKQERLMEEMMNLASRIFVHILKCLLTCKVLRHEATGFTSHPNYGVADFYLR